MSAIQAIENELIRLHEMFHSADSMFERDSIRKQIDKLHDALVKELNKVPK